MKMKRYDIQYNDVYDELQRIETLYALNETVWSSFFSLHKILQRCFKKNDNKKTWRILDFGFWDIFKLFSPHTLYIDPPDLISRTNSSRIIL